MTTEAYPGDDPHRLLSSARDLVRRVRKEQRATWFPLLVFAALTFISIPVRRYSGHHLDCQGNGGSCRVYSDADFWYWRVALVLAYLAIAIFYVRRSRAKGLGTRVLPYVVVGIVVAVALTGAALWELHQPPAEPSPLAYLYRLVLPGGSVGLALLVLAWVEHNRALLALTLAYLAVILVPIPSAQFQANPPWYALPAVTQGAVLLLGGIGFALAQRPLRVRAS
jgi:hypothetical protein